MNVFPSPWECFHYSIYLIRVHGGGRGEGEKTRRESSCSSPSHLSDNLLQMEAESNFESSQAPQIQSLDPSEPPVETQDVQMQEPEQQDQAVHDQVRHKTTEDSAEARNDSKEAETEGDGEGGEEDGYDGEGQDGDEADGDDGEDGEGIGEIEDESGNQSDPASSEGGSDSRKSSSAKGRPRGRPPGTSKVHRGAGRGPLTLNRRGRGRPRKEGAAGRILHEGKIIEPTAKPEGEEAGQGTEGGEDSEVSSRWKMAMLRKD